MRHPLSEPWEDTEANNNFMYYLSIFMRITGIVMIIFVIVISLRQWPGRDFPNESELQYTEGTLQSYQQKVYKSGTWTITALMPSNLKGIEYQCEYTTNRQPSQCFSKEFLKPYIGKPAKIGWFYQKDFLWYHNPKPQLVTLEVEGKVIHSYQDGQKKIARYKKIGIYIGVIVIPFLLFGFTFYYYCGHLLAKRTKHKRGKK